MTTSASDSTRPIPVFFQDKLALTITTILLAAAAISWLASYYLMPLMMMNSSSGMMTTNGVAAIVSSLSIPSVAFFEIVWIIGMAAMMFPAMIPMVLFYNKVKAKLETNPRLAKIAGTPLFLSGYLLTYALLGIGAYLAIYAAITVSMNFSYFNAIAFIVPSAILIVTGLYQFSSLKTRCMSQCVSPFGFFATRSKNGLSGAFQMGFSHGIFCVGCCWAYMLVMLAVGAMGIPIMAALTGVIALEKVVVRGSVWFTRIVAIGFIALGVLVGLFPVLLTYV
jgi:predicted metal-binding membrane protein